jgi:hypothetical protein
VFSGTGTLDRGAPWQWTAWSWQAERDGQVIVESDYDVTPTGLAVRRRSWTSDHVPVVIESKLDLFDCQNYARRLAALHAAL